MARGADPASCTAAGPGLNAGVAASAATTRQFSVTLNDAYGNPAAAAATTAVTATVTYVSLDVASFPWLASVPNAVAVAVTPPPSSSSDDDANVHVVSFATAYPGTYVIVVAVDGGGGSAGGSAGEIAGSPFALSVAPAAAPALRSAALASSLQHVVVSFSADTDRGVGVGAATCDDFVSAATAAMLGAGAVCYWPSPAELHLGLGDGATLKVQTDAAAGDAVEMKAGAVFAAAGNSRAVAVRATPAAAAVVKLPTEGLEPLTASLNVPPVLGPCDGVVLDASDSRGPGRALTFAFTVAAAGAGSAAVDVAAAAAALAAASPSSAVVAVAAEALPAGASLAFAVTVRDWLGRSATATASTSKTRTPALAVAVAGPAELTVQSGAPLTLEAIAAMPSALCLVGGGATATSTAAVSFEWSVTGDAAPVTLSAAEATRPTLTVAAASLRPGATYRVAVVATAAGAEPARAAVVVSVVAPPLFVAGSLGNDRAAPADAALRLAATPYDPAEARDALGAPYPFTYVWSCALRSGAACFAAGSEGAAALLRGANGVVTLAGGTMRAGESHVFTAKVSRLPVAAGRAGVEATVTVVAVPPPDAATAAGTPPPSLAPPIVTLPPADVALLMVRGNERKGGNGKIKSGRKIVGCFTHSSFIKC